jgi:lipopolysaccharide export LptBFGC system permease protein LptF
MRVLDRHCLRESSINFGFYSAAYLALVSVLVCAPLLKQGAPLGAVLQFLPDNLLFISMLALPLAMVTAFLATVGRMREDGEITALMAAGISAIRVALAMLPLAVMLALWLGVAMHLVLPRVAKRLIEGRAELANQAASTQIARHRPIFQTENDTAMVSAVRVQGDMLQRLFAIYFEKGIYEEGPVTVAYAPTARFVTDPSALSADEAGALELRDAWVLNRTPQTAGTGETVVTGELPLWSLRLPEQRQTLSDIQDSLSTPELRQRLATTVETKENRRFVRGLERAWHLRWIIPVAVIAYWAFAVGLGLSMGKSNRLLAVFIGLLTVVATLVPSFGLVKSLGGRMTFDAGWVLWPPVLLLACSGGFLLWRQR